MADNGTSPSVDAVQAATRTMSDSVQEALDAKGKAPTEYECENGVVLGLRRVSRMLIAQSMTKLNRERPKPPMVKDEDTQREYINELDPGYLDAKDEFETKVALHSMSMSIGLGTYLKSTPDDLAKLGVEGPDSDNWVKLIHDFEPDLEIPAPGTSSRYVAWLQFYCLSDVDSTIVQGALMGFYGQTREEAVAEAMESFPGTVRRDSDNGSGATPSNEVDSDSNRD